MIYRFLVFIVLITSIQCQHQPSYEDYSHKPMHVEVKGSRGVMLDEAEKLFNEKNYELANLHLSRLAGYYQTNAGVQLYYGISLLETGQYPMADMQFEKVAQTSSPEQYEAVWYLAMSKLIQNDLPACKTFLKEIPKESHMFEKASELLDRLE